MGKRKRGQLDRPGATRSVNHINSFCRKTTLTKHFRRWHTDEEISSEEGSDVGQEDSPEGILMTRQSSNYIGDLWPLPGHAAPSSRPHPFESTLVSRPKSMDSIKIERPATIGLSDTLPHPNAGGMMSSFEFLRSRTGLTPEQVGIQTVLPSNFHGMPLSQPYPTENEVESWAPSTLITKLGPSGYSDYPSEPPSAQSTVFFPESTAQDYSLQVVDISLHESMPFSPDHSTPIQSANSGMDGMSTGHHVSGFYNLCATPISEQHVPFHPAPLSTPQPPQSLPIPASLVPFYALTDNNAQYYTSAAPEWLTRIKPEENWPGVLPSDYFYN